MIGYCEGCTSFGAAACKHFAAVFCGHSFAEAVLVDAATVGGLECSFHCCMLLYLLADKERKDSILSLSGDGFDLSVSALGLQNYKFHLNLQNFFKKILLYMCGINFIAKFVADDVAVST